MKRRRLPARRFAATAPKGGCNRRIREVLARNGIVSTVQPLASQAGLRILQQGGNAIDAAVATAAMLNVVFPGNVGIGGDLFALIYVAKEKKVYQLNASGIAPAGLTLERMQSLGYKANPANFGPGSGMPSGGILTVTVPGSFVGMAGSADALRHEDVQGSPAAGDRLRGPGLSRSRKKSPIVWRMKNALPLQGCCTQVDPDSVKTFYVNGKPPVTGTIFRNPDLAKAFRLIQQQRRDAFYKGEIGRAIIAKSQALGGPMTLDDLANYKGEWVTPASTAYHSEFTVYGTQGALAGVGHRRSAERARGSAFRPGIRDRRSHPLGPASPQYWHALIETKKVVYGDVYGHNADPNAVPVPLDMLTSKPHAASLCGKVNPSARVSHRIRRERLRDGAGDTIYLATADRWGNMVSWINSNFSGWGSGITVPGYGFILHNRGGLFTLDPKSPNVIAGNKRPYNTLSAVLVMQNGRPLLVTGQHGGDQQGQGNMQVLVNILDLGANVQAAGDMARFSHNQVTQRAADGIAALSRSSERA